MFVVWSGRDTRFPRKKRFNTLTEGAVTSISTLDVMTTLVVYRAIFFL